MAHLRDSIAVGVSLVRPADRVAVPWKNGAGSTEEIARTSRWRCSIAALGTLPSTFSSFADIDRTFTVIGEHGVRLDWPSHSVELEPWQPYAFAGRDAPFCLPRGNTSALNVMVDAHTARATVETSVTAAGLTIGADEVAIAYVRSGTAEMGYFMARAGDCLVVEHSAVSVGGGGELVLVRIRSKTPFTSN